MNKTAYSVFRDGVPTMVSVERLSPEEREQALKTESRAYLLLLIDELCGIVAEVEDAMERTKKWVDKFDSLF